IEPLETTHEGLSFEWRRTTATLLRINHCDRRDFDQHARASESSNRYQGAGREIAARKNFASYFHELVAVAHVANKHRHIDDVVESAAGSLQRSLNGSDWLEHRNLPQDFFR